MSSEQFVVTKYPPGTFSWADCMVPDAAAGKQFYTELMGWGSQDIPMGEGMGNYSMFLRDGHHVAALSGRPPFMADVPACWTSYVTVDDVDASAAKATSLGASITMDPSDVFDSGRMVMLQDPAGAQLALWQPRNHIGARLVNVPGAPCWNELYTTDSARAQEFYGALLGWTFEEDANNPFYSMIRNNGRYNGGIMQMDEEMQKTMPPCWLPYFSVADIEAAAARVTGLGGAVHIGPLPAGDVGRFVLFTDPQGSHCYLIQLAQPEPWSESG